MHLKASLVSILWYKTVCTLCTDIMVRGPLLPFFTQLQGVQVFFSRTTPVSSKRVSCVFHDVYYYSNRMDFCTGIDISETLFKYYPKFHGNPKMFDRRD